MNPFDLAIESAARVLLALPKDSRATRRQELVDELARLFAPEMTREGTSREALDIDLGAVLMKLEAAPPQEDGPLPLAVLTREVWYRLERRFTGKETPIPLPWPHLAALLGGGLWPGLTVLVGTPASGKSQLACQLALHAAQQGVSVAYLALELGRADLTARLVGASTGLPWSSLYLGKLPALEQQQALVGLQELAKLPLFVEVGNPGQWPAERIEQAVLKVREARRGPLLVILDFLQLVGDKDTRGDVRERVGQAAYEARRVARDLDVSILAISSTSRANYKVGQDLFKDAGLSYDEATGRGAIRHPEALLSLAKESGEIEFAVDNLLCALKWPEPLPAKEGAKAILLAAPKLRCGEPGWCELRFNGTSFQAPADDGAALRLAMRGSSTTTTTRSKATSSHPRNGHHEAREDEEHSRWEE